MLLKAVFRENCQINKEEERTQWGLQKLKDLDFREIFKSNIKDNLKNTECIHNVEKILNQLKNLILNAGKLK